MKALSLLQPWASLVAAGAKRYETRSWGTDYRGPLAIHASKSAFEGREYFLSSEVAQAALDGLCWLDLPRGAIVATARLTDCFRSRGLPPPDRCQHEGAFGNFERGRFLWKLEDVRPIQPAPARGSLGLWEWSNGARPGGPT